MRKNARHPQVPSSDIEKLPKRDINTLDCCQLTAPPTHTINKEFCPRSLHGESIYVIPPTNRNPTQRWHLNFSLLVSLTFILLYFLSLPSFFSVCSSCVNVRFVLCCVYALHLGSQLSPILKNCDWCEHPVTNTELSDTTVLLLYCLSLRLLFIIRFLLWGVTSLFTFHPFSHVNVIKVQKMFRCVLTLYSNSLSVSYTPHATEFILFLPQYIKTCIY